jgi:hypothetical protein
MTATGNPFPGSRTANDSASTMQVRHNDQNNKGRRSLDCRAPNDEDNILKFSQLRALRMLAAHQAVEFGSTAM